MAKGPAGPASAISGTNYILFTLIEALKEKRAPRTLEIWALVVAIIGAMVVVVPAWFEGLLRKAHSVWKSNYNQSKLEEERRPKKKPNTFEKYEQY